MSSKLPLVPGFIENFILNWADKRQPSSSHQLTIDRHHLYILPTRHGIGYFIIILLILFVSINYENSSGFMLAFLLGSLGILGMVYTHQNINRLKIKIGRAESVFAGQNVLFPVYISQSIPSLHPNLKLLSETGQTISAHLVNEKNTECKLPLSTTHRGYIKPGRIKIFSEYPLGLFHAWSWLKLDSQCLVYPAPAPHHYPLDFSEENIHGLFSNNKQGMDDFAGIRQYQVGDLANHMAWKAIAKTGELQTKLFNNESTQKIYINWSHTDETLQLEQRLSVLCRMVLDASQQNINFGLHIPGTRIPPACGLQHKHRCLKALALFGVSE